MIYEILTQRVEPEKRDEYIKVFGDVLKQANYAGSHSIKFFTSIEDPSQVMVMIEWDSVEAHTQHRDPRRFVALPLVLTPTHKGLGIGLEASTLSTLKPMRCQWLAGVS